MVQAQPNTNPWTARPKVVNPDSHWNKRLVALGKQRLYGWHFGPYFGPGKGLTTFDGVIRFVISSQALTKSAFISFRQVLALT